MKRKNEFIWVIIFFWLVVCTEAEPAVWRNSNTYHKHSNNVIRDRPEMNYYYLMLLARHLLFFETYRHLFLDLADLVLWRHELWKVPYNKLLVSSTFWKQLSLHMLPFLPFHTQHRNHFRNAIFSSKLLQELKLSSENEVKKVHLALKFSMIGMIQWCGLPTAYQDQQCHDTSSLISCAHLI